KTQENKATKPVHPEPQAIRNKAVYNTRLCQTSGLQSRRIATQAEMPENGDEEDTLETSYARGHSLEGFLRHVKIGEQRSEGLPTGLNGVGIITGCVGVLGEAPFRGAHNLEEE
ncbi:MAG: hypothetical protein Q9211_007056, partial [Gyalolechia sp. 1 TL-2023]